MFIARYKFGINALKTPAGELYRTNGFYRPRTFPGIAYIHGPDRYVLWFKRIHPSRPRFEKQRDYNRSVWDRPTIIEWR